MLHQCQTQQLTSQASTEIIPGAGYPFIANGLDEQAIQLPVIFIDGEQVKHRFAMAIARPDGYYVVAIPIGRNRYSVAIQFGAKFKELHIESVEAMPVQSFQVPNRQAQIASIPLAPSLAGMEQFAPHIFSCDDHAALMLVQPPVDEADETIMVVVVFRPVTTWLLSNSQMQNLRHHAA